MDKMIFYLNSENSENNWFFVVNCSNEQWENYIDEGDERGTLPLSYDQNLCIFVAILEDLYGVLDGGGTVDNEIYSNGYQSYEVLESNFPIILNHFRKWFETRGFILGDNEESKTMNI